MLAEAPKGLPKSEYVETEGRVLTVSVEEENADLPFGGRQMITSGGHERG